MGRLLYLVDWLPPDYGAIGQYALLESRQRAQDGESILLVGFSSERDSVEEHDFGDGQLTILRLHRPPVNKSHMPKRAAWTLQTNLVLAWQVIRHRSDIDQILFTGSPPFLEYLLSPISRLVRKPITFRVADFHPECSIGRYDGDAPRTLLAFQQLSIRLRRTIDHFEVLGQDAKRVLVSQGIAPERITIRRSMSPVDIDETTEPLTLPDALEGRSVLLYSGAVGFAHDYATFVEGYRRHHHAGSGRVVLWLNANGVLADEFEQAARQARTPIHRSHGVALEQLGNLLVTADAHLVTLRDKFVGLCVPSKIYGAIASRKQILFVGSPQSDVHLLCSEQVEPGHYQRANVGDAQAVCNALELIADRALASPTERS